jgi:hypothetical protein
MSYVIRRAPGQPELAARWDGEIWRHANTLELTRFHPMSRHFPQTRARLLYDETGLYVIFHVRDRWVYSVHTNLHDPVSHDSCVEFFVEPADGKGYFNFEFNCGGTMLLYHIRGPRDPETGLRNFTKVSPDHAALVRVHHSMPRIVQPEIEEPTDWTLEWFVPWELFEAYIGPIAPQGGSVWRGNFFKCGSLKRHHAWWADIDEPLNFHQPQRFAALTFEARQPVVWAAEPVGAAVVD